MANVMYTVANVYFSGDGVGMLLARLFVSVRQVMCLVRGSFVAVVPINVLVE